MSPVNFLYPNLNEAMYAYTKGSRDEMCGISLLEIRIKGRHLTPRVHFGVRGTQNSPLVTAL